MTVPRDRRPERRRLRIYAFDPMRARGGDHRIHIEVPYRKITRTDGGRSFKDDRLEVIDYDGAVGTYYTSVDLDDPEIAMQGGLEWLESDPQFHQQMVYAVASRVLENFDRALGRRLRFWGGQRLRLLPHAFQGRNAYYDHVLNAVLFGYFPADESDPGPNLPGQPVFTCLSHDIIAHEVTHAALDRLHRHYREPSNPQVAALHEAFADLVALFQRFTFTEIVRRVIAETRNDILAPGNPMLEVGAQFGAAAGQGAALRTVRSQPDASLIQRTRRPHALGHILTDAVVLGFADTYRRRTADLVRIATGGSGRLPDGDLHPDLVQRLTAECTRTAQAVLSMCIRATDYMPPVDPTFSDFLRAMITADFEINRTDELGLRSSMIEAFRLHGIRPAAVGSLAVESLLLEPHQSDQDPDPGLADIVRRLLDVGARDLSRHAPPDPEVVTTKRTPHPVRHRSDLVAQLAMELDAETEVTEPDEPHEAWRALAIDLQRWMSDHKAELHLDPVLPVKVWGFHPVHRVSPSGELVLEMVAQGVQTRRTSEDLGGLSDRAGVTIVVGVDGRIRYLIGRPFSEQRDRDLRQWVAWFDGDRGTGWKPARTGHEKRLVEAFSTRALHGGRR